jgi:cytochrome b561
MNSSKTRYTHVAIILHWLIATGIISLVGMGVAMIQFPLPLKISLAIYQLHKSVGITVLFLILLRVLWRLSHPAPPLPLQMNRRQQCVANLMHRLLYVLMLWIPLTGWFLLSVSTHNYPFRFFGTFWWPELPIFGLLHRSASNQNIVRILHVYGGWIISAAVVLHVIAALRHWFVDHDDVLERMIPMLRRTSK